MICNKLERELPLFEQRLDDISHGLGFRRSEVYAFFGINKSGMADLSLFMACAMAVLTGPFIVSVKIICLSSKA